MIAKNLVNATVSRNKLGPESARCISLIPVTEGSGTTLVNRGIGAGAGCTWPAAAYADAVASGSGLVWHDADYLELSQSSSDDMVTLIAGGAGVTLTEGTLTIVLWTPVDLGANVFAIMGVTGTAANGRLAIQHLADGKARVFLRAGGANVNLDTAAAIDWLVPHVFVIGWGLRSGFWADVDGEHLTSPATTQALVVPAGESLVVGRNGAVYTPTNFAFASFHDLPLAGEYRRRLAADPYLMARPIGDADVWLHGATPWCGWATGTTAGLMMTTLANAPAGMRWAVDYGTSPTALTSSGASDVGAGGRECLPIDLSGLTAGALYWYRARWSADGVTWQPTPGGMKYFYAKPAAGTSFTFAMGGDCHSGDNAHSPRTAGVGSEALAATYTSASAGQGRLFGNWATDRDLILRLDTVRPHFTIHVGDFVQNDSTGLIVADDPNALADDNAAMDAHAVMAVDHRHEFIGCGVSHQVPGNHDWQSIYISGNQVLPSAVDIPGAWRKQQAGTWRRLIYSPPHGTYLIGGAATEADDSDIGDLGDPAPTGIGWLPDLTLAKYTEYVGEAGNGAVGFLDDFVRRADVLDPGPHYYTFEWGDLCCVIGDTMTPADPGDSAVATVSGEGTGQHFRAASIWDWDETQDLSVDRALRDSTCAHKIICVHCSIGNELDGLFYGWGEPGGRLLATAKRRRVTAIFFGHVHEFAHKIVDGIHCFWMPHASTPPDWDTADWRDVFGSLSSHGADKVAPGDGLGTADGVLYRANLPGYVLVHVTPAALTVEFRQTGYSHVIEGAPNYKLTLTPRFDIPQDIGPEVTAVANVATVSETPTDVAFAILSDDVPAYDGWEADLSADDVKGAVVGDYAGDEDFASAAVTLDVSVDGDAVQVLALPATRYTGTAVAPPTEAPEAPVAATATSIIASRFTANWMAVDYADSYELDVATDDAFVNLVDGYDALDVGDTTSAVVTGLSPETDYWYRVRAVNTIGTSDPSNTVKATTIAPPTAGNSVNLLGDDEEVFKYGAEI